MFMCACYITVCVCYINACVCVLHNNFCVFMCMLDCVSCGGAVLWAVFRLYDGVVVCLCVCVCVLTPR